MSYQAHHGYLIQSDLPKQMTTQMTQILLYYMHVFLQTRVQRRGPHSCCKTFTNKKLVGERHLGAQTQRSIAIDGLQSDEGIDIQRVGPLTSSVQTVRQMLKISPILSPPAHKLLKLRLQLRKLRIHELNATILGHELDDQRNLKDKWESSLGKEASMTERPGIIAKPDFK